RVERDEEDPLEVDRARRRRLDLDPPACEPPPVGCDRERLVAESNPLLVGDRLFRPSADLVVPAERLVPGRPPVVDGVGGEAADEGVYVLPLPRAAVDVEPAVELVERHLTRSLRLLGHGRRCARRSASSRRRSRFVGRAERSAPSGLARRRSARRRSRSASDSGVSSYSSAAALAGPRRSASPVTRTVKRSWPRLISRRSPSFTSRAGFARSPFASTCPPATASVAAPRVLKNRADHSHLSILTRSTAGTSRR